MKTPSTSKPERYTVTFLRRRIPERPSCLGWYWSLDDDGDYHGPFRALQQAVRHLARYAPPFTSAAALGDE